MNKRLSRQMRGQHIELEYLRYKMLALDMFEYENLPNGIESRFIEVALLENGECGFAYDDKLGFIALPCNTSSNIDIYGQPLAINLLGCGYNKRFTLEKAVRILNNDLVLPTDYYLRDYAQRIGEIELMIQANTLQQKTPYIFEGDDDSVLTMKTINKNIQDFEPCVFVNKSLNIENALKVHGTDVPFKGLDLYQLKEKLETELMTFLGANNTKEKKERMLVDEVNVNNDFIDRNYDIMYRQRKLAIDKINKMFNLNIIVKKKSQIDDMEGINGELYD